MAHPIDNHQKAVEYANACTLAKFKKHGPYEPGSVENKYWLSMYDQFLICANLDDYHREIL